MQVRLRTFLILGAICPPLLAFLYYGPVVTVWDGQFTLNVQLVNETDKAIDHVDAAVMSSRHEAELLVENPNIERGWQWKRTNPDAADIVQISIKCSGHVNWFGREISYWQEPAITLRVVFDDGTESRYAVDTPRERGIVRNLVATIPSGDCEHRRFQAICNELVGVSMMHGLVSEEVLQKYDHLVLEEFLRAKKSSVDIKHSAYGRPFLRYLLFQDWPKFIADLNLSEEQLFYNRYFWARRFTKAYQAVNGADAGLEQQVFQILEQAPQGPDWAIIESIENNVGE